MIEIEVHGIQFQLLKHDDGCWALVEPISGLDVYRGVKGHHRLDVLDQAKLRLEWAGAEKTQERVAQAQKHVAVDRTAMFLH
jgi:hypothetical protein